ncbi:MAG TPA: glycosyltransferase [Solirubrobacteraceae bacterium]|nr:glycosyltransferase [Solirubrobacteraceae bacterium]
MRVAVVAEFYPRHHDPVLGVWAHRQALATAAAGVEVSVFVLHRLVPPRRELKGLWALARQPTIAHPDGLAVRYLRYVSPPRGRAYARWGAWAAPALARALEREGPFDLVHAHNAVPAGDAVLRTATGAPLVVSVHGGDVLWTSVRAPGGRDVVDRVLGSARLVLANSRGIERLAREHGAARTRVVHLGTDLPPAPGSEAPTPLIVTVAHLVARKRHADVLAALAKLPGVRYLVIGEGPERGALERRAQELGVGDRVEFTGQLPPAAAARRASEAWCFVMPSTEEAFGVAYIEAMAAGIPAIGCAGEPGPAEIVAAGDGIELVAPRSPDALAERLRVLLGDGDARRALGARARATVEREFTWPRCGEQTLAAYEEALR